MPKDRRFIPARKRLVIVAAALAAFSSWALAPAAYAEGSRELVANATTPSLPAGNGGKRTVLEWRNDDFVNTFKRRTLLHVYVNAGEQIHLGSSAAGVGSGNMVVFSPGSFPTFAWTQLPISGLPAPVFDCGAAQPTKGHLTTRTQEIAGPLPAAGGYDPCTFPATQTGVHYVAFYGPLGPTASGQGVAVDGEAGSITAPNATTSQDSGVSLWDVTVRNPGAGNTDIPGRLFTDYLAALTGGNGTSFRVNSTVYALTGDGYKYKIDLRGLDPFGFILYGTRIGYFDSDGQTPLYHDLYDGLNNDLSAPHGGVQISLPDTKLFVQQPAADLPASIAPTPVAPVLGSIAFAGTAGGNSSIYTTGGNFVYSGNVGGITEIVISRDGINFDPTNVLNRVVRADKPGGATILSWNGKANDGTFFPVGGPYSFKVTLHSGEIHFPLIDAENSQLGGPTITLINPPGGVCAFPGPAGCRIAFYDDRGYRTLDGTEVGTVGSVLPSLADPNAGPPPTTHSDPINGYDSSNNQRAFGNGSGLGNGFGDKKGLDIWAFYPSAALQSTLNIVTQPVLPPDPTPPALEATPELSSIMLFGSGGAMSLGSYALARYRARRGSRRSESLEGSGDTGDTGDTEDALISEDAAQNALDSSDALEAPRA